MSRNDDGRSFRQQIGDVEPLGVGNRRAAPTTPRSRAPAAESTPAFHRPDPEEPRLAHTPGVNRRDLRRLRRGKPAPDAEVDLHGLDARAARAALREAVAETCAAGRICLRVVHGRGAHSPGGPVLRSALPGWLTEPGVAEHVLAFAPFAGAPDGGAGSTLVLLRH